MTQKEAREIIMQTTRDAMQTWNNLHNNTKKNDLDARLSFINDFVGNLVPEEVRALAV